MTPRLFFAATLIGTGMLLCSPAGATTDYQCEDRAANCVGRCANPGGGVNDNKCMVSCDRRVTTCLIRADERWHRNFPMRAWVR
jgi:hypothetical protein